MKRVQLSRAKNWRKPEGCIVVARPSRWGNPFVLGLAAVIPGEVVDVDRRLAVEMYRSWLRHNRHLDVTPLRGHDLACWCPLDQPCHADVLLELANS